MSEHFVALFLLIFSKKIQKEKVTTENKNSRGIQNNANHIQKRSRPVMSRQQK